MIEKFVCVDVEMPNGNGNRISAIGISVFENGALTQQYYSLINPETWFQPYVIELIGITPEMVKTAPTFPEYWTFAQPILKDALIVAHGAGNDLKALSGCLRHYHIEHPAEVRYLCTVDACTACYPERQTYSLDALCDDFEIPLTHHHARSDSEACGRLLLQCLNDGLDPAPLIRTFDLNAGHNKRQLPKTRKKRAAMAPAARVELELTAMLKPSMRPAAGEPLCLLSESFLQNYVQKNRSHEYLYRFLQELPHTTENENNLHAVLLSGRTGFSAAVQGVDAFLPFIRSAETVAMLRPRVFQKRQPELAEWLQRWLCADAPYSVLFALQTLRRCYIRTPSLPTFLDLSLRLNCESEEIEAAVVAFFAAAMVKDLPRFAPFFKAHRTDARVQRALALALSRENLPPQKRARLEALNADAETT